MLWVEIRQLAFVAICWGMFIEAIVLLAVTNANGAQIFCTLLVVALASGALYAVFRHFDRGRRARYAPILLEWLGISSGVVFALWQIYDVCRGLHSTRDTTALLTGLTIAVVLIAAAIARRRYARR